MSPHTRPEMVIRRAEELLGVDQPLAALSCISEVFSSKRFRTTPLSVLEPILIKFLELCVTLRKGRTAKEGLHIYKNVAQNTSVLSVQVVITNFLDQSKLKLTQALIQVDSTNQEQVEDLEASETPESILKSSVSDLESSREATYRTIVTPWLRFLWEAYRTALDILRNNARLEVLYQAVSHQAFQFCLTHQRKTEFRRLSETLRSHLNSSQKYSHQSHSINLNDPDTLQRHLDTRFQQLNTAVELELWQEAFRTAEDIHNLLGMSKRAPKAAVMASFYEKMVKVFGVGQNFLFHAAAYGKLYSLHAARAALSGDRAEDLELGELSSSVLLSALAVPIGSGENGRRKEPIEEGEAKGKLGRLAALLGLANAPTRTGLITDALNRHVLKRVSPELRSLYNILEVDFHPLSITAKIEPILASLALKPETARYVEPLKEVVLARLFQQLAQVYASLKIDRVVKLAGFEMDGEIEITRKRVERFITESCRRGDLDVTINHAAGSITFKEDLFGSEIAAIGTTTAYDLQPSAASLLRTHLTRLATTLYQTLDIVSPTDSPIAVAISAREAAFAILESKGQDERDNLSARSAIIKRRKELADENSVRIQQEEAAARIQRAALKAEEDARKVKEDIKNRELERIKKDLAATRKAEAIKLAEALAAKNGLKVDLKDIENLDSGKLVQLQVEQIEKEKKDLAQKLTGVSKRIDHLERAFRREEIPLLKLDYERQQTRDRLAFESDQSFRVESARKQHLEDLEIKTRLVKILPDYLEYRTRVEMESKSAWERRNAAQAKTLELKKADRREQVMEQRAADERRRVEEEAEAAVAKEENDRLAAIRADQAAEEAAYKAKSEELMRAQAEAADADKNAARNARIAQQAADDAAARAREAKDEERMARQGNRGGNDSRDRAPVVGSASYRAGGAGGMSERPKMALAARTVAVPVAEPARAEPVRLAPYAPRAPVVAPVVDAPFTAVAPKKAGGWREKEAAKLAAANGGEAPAQRAPSGTYQRREAPPAENGQGQGQGGRSRW